MGGETLEWLVIAFARWALFVGREKSGVLRVHLERVVGRLARYKRRKKKNFKVWTTANLSGKGVKIKRVSRPINLEQFVYEWRRHGCHPRRIFLN